MKNQILSTLLTLVFCSIGQAAMSIDEFTEIKTVSEQQSIECEKINELELQLITLKKEANDLGKLRNVEIDNNNLEKAEQISLLLNVNEKRRTQTDLKLNSMKDIRFQTKFSLNFSGLGKFLLQTNTGVLYFSGVTKYERKEAISQVKVIVYPQHMSTKPSYAMFSEHYDEMTLNMTQGEYCFSGQANAAVVEYTLPSMVLTVTHHIGFDLQQAKIEKLADIMDLKNQVFRKKINPVIFQFFGLSNLYLTSDELVAPFTRGEKTQKIYQQQSELNPADFLKYVNAQEGLDEIIKKSNRVEYLRGALKLAKEKLNSRHQIQNEELSAMLNQEQRFKTYQNGLLGLVLNNGSESIEILFGNDSIGLFIERINIKEATIYHADANEPANKKPECVPNSDLELGGVKLGCGKSHTFGPPIQAKKQPCIDNFGNKILCPVLKPGVAIDLGF